jgi:hypothetical protein
MEKKKKRDENPSFSEYSVVKFLSGLGADFDVDAGSDREDLELVDGVRSWI